MRRFPLRRDDISRREERRNNVQNTITHQCDRLCSASPPAIKINYNKLTNSLLYTGIITVAVAKLCASKPRKNFSYFWHTRTHTHSRSHSLTHAHTHAHTLSHTHTHTHSHTHTHAHTHKLTHTLTHTRSHAHTHTHTLTHSHTRSHARAHTHTLTHTHTHTLTRTHSYTHTHTHTHTHTLTHTRARTSLLLFDRTDHSKHSVPVYRHFSSLRFSDKSSQVLCISFRRSNSWFKRIKVSRVQFIKLPLKSNALSFAMLYAYNTRSANAVRYIKLFQL
jgi:hypothetical protein